MSARKLLYASLILALMVAGAATERFPTTAREPQAASSLAAVSTSTISPNSSGRTNSGIWYQVEHVVDGDTIDILMNGKKVRVRLIGLDTPEIVDPRKPVQCFGRESSEKAKRLLAEKYVRIEMDASQDDYDKYGRLLAYIFLPDGTNFAEEMIAEGYGHEYTYRLPYKYQKEFKAAEQKAREEKKGLWSAGVCGL